MLREIKIENYKSILNDTIELGRINVFIGANGSGKTNILEALAMVAASKDNDLNVEGLYNRGVRVTKPNLTFSSFKGSKNNRKINIEFKLQRKKEELKQDIDNVKKIISRSGLPIVIGDSDKFYIFGISSILYCENENDIYSEWRDEFSDIIDNELFMIPSSQFSQGSIYADMYLKELKDINDELSIEFDKKLDTLELLKRLRARLEDHYIDHFSPKFRQNINSVLELEYMREFMIYTLNTQALRGIISESKKQPLGINGEGLDILLANFGDAESERIQQYNYLVSWLDEMVLDEKDVLKYKGHKLGRSTSILYFKDKFMRKNNNVFSAENANEGALHILFYLALFISKKTPQLFAIDNIETALNPRVCRTLVKELAQLAKENNKQALITTHNPAILDGLNLNDDEQRLFVVYRTDEGHTKTKRIKHKPETKDGNRKLSELWMRGDLGGIPNDF